MSLWNFNLFWLFETKSRVYILIICEQIVYNSFKESINH